MPTAEAAADIRVPRHLIRATPCPACGALPGDQCHDAGHPRGTHAARLLAAIAVADREAQEVAS